MPAKQSRRWTWTLHDRDDDSTDYCVHFGGLVDAGLLQYVCFGREVCPTTGLGHLQGYLELRKKKSLGGVKSIIERDRIHLEASKGSQAQNIAYCKKDGSFNEYGRKMCEVDGDISQRTADAQALLKSGGSILQIAETDFAFFLRHARTLQLYKSLLDGERNSPTIGFWLWGPTGTGKSRTAFEHSSKSYHSVCWLPDNSGKWFDGYEKEEAVVFDDITPTCRPEMSLMLRLLDRYPLRVPVKGGFRNFAARAVYITSNFAPEQIYPGHQLPALMRRLDCVIHLE